jgi:hypothetical protein
MGVSMILLGVLGLGGCAVLGAALIGVVWVIMNERRSKS